MEFINDETIETVEELKINDDLKKMVFEFELLLNEATEFDEIYQNFIDLMNILKLRLSENFDYKIYDLYNIVYELFINKFDIDIYDIAEYLVIEKFISKLHEKYSKNMTDDQLVENLKCRSYFKHNNIHNIIGTAIKYKYIKSLTILLSFKYRVNDLNGYYILDSIIMNYYNYNLSDILPLLIETGLTNYYYSATINSKEIVDLLTNLQIVDYTRLYKIQDPEVLKYFMNQTDYDIRTCNQKIKIFILKLII